MAFAGDPGKIQGLKEVLTWLFTGCLIGLLFLVGIQLLEAKWFSFLFLGVISSCFALLPMDRKAIFLMFLVLSIPMGIDKNLFFQYSNFHHSSYGFQISLFYIPLVALIAIRMGRSWSDPDSVRPISTKGLFALTGIFGAAVVSILLAGNTLFGAFDLFAFLWSIILFTYLSTDPVDRRDLESIMVTLAFAVAIEGAIALCQRITDSTLGLEFFGAYTSRELQSDSYRGLDSMTRAGGTLGHPNNLALFFDLSIPLTLSLMFTPLGRRTKMMVAAAVGFGLMGLSVTLSRGGLISTSIGCAILAIAWLRHRIGLFRAILIFSVMGVFILLIALRPTGTLYKRFLEDDYQAARTRIPLITVATNMIKDHPLFGVGLNNYNELALRYDTSPEWISAEWNAPVHNIFLYVAAQIGLIGLLFFLLYLFAVFRALWPALWVNDPFVAWTGRGLAVSMLSYLIHVQIEFVSFTHSMPFWFSCGLAVGLGRFALELPSKVRPEAST